MPPPLDPLGPGPGPVSEQVRCMPALLSWTQAHKPRLDSCFSAATNLLHDSGVLTSWQLEKGMIITSTHRAGMQEGENKTMDAEVLCKAESPNTNVYLMFIV